MQFCGNLLALSKERIALPKLSAIPRVPAALVSLIIASSKSTILIDGGEDLHRSAPAADIDRVGGPSTTSAAFIDAPKEALQANNRQIRAE